MLISLTYMMEKTVTFSKVDDINANRLKEVTLILHSEVEPLQVARSVGIISHEYIESCAIFDAYLVKVGAFKVRIEGNL